MATYFSSDEHFGHQNIIKFSGRPYKDVPEMNEALVENWNATVGHDDKVWMLGDIVMGHIAETLPLCARLNGTKILLCGNHDRPWVGYKHHYRASATQQKADWVRRYKEEGGFSEIHDGSEPLFYPLLTGRPGEYIDVVLSHFPYEGDHTADERYLDYRPKDEGRWLLHGHVHEAWKVRGRQINVGVDVWDYTPVSEEALADIILGRSAGE
jgi:calcineurin-like phosphoesterase family protein